MLCKLYYPKITLCRPLSAWSKYTQFRTKGKLLIRSSHFALWPSPCGVCVYEKQAPAPRRRPPIRQPSSLYIREQTMRTKMIIFLFGTRRDKTRQTLPSSNFSLCALRVSFVYPKGRYFGENFSLFRVFNLFFGSDYSDPLRSQITDTHRARGFITR